MSSLLAVTLAYWCAVLVLGLGLTVALREVLRQSPSPSVLSWRDTALIGLCSATALGILAVVVGAARAEVAAHVFVGSLLPIVFAYFDTRKRPVAVQSRDGTTQVIGLAGARDAALPLIPTVVEPARGDARDGTTQVIGLAGARDAALPLIPTVVEAPAEAAPRSDGADVAIWPGDDELRTITEAPEDPALGEYTALAEMGARVSAARRAAGLLTTEAAGQAGISTDQWQRLEAGTWNPTVRALTRVARVLGLPARDLIG